MTVFRASNPEFVFQLFQTDFYDTQVKADLGATINSINGKNFLKYEFPIPKNPKEQQKIAYCLSSLDEVISANSQKLDLLKDHKKALMQNLFPQEGEKVPKYRFKEFEKDGEWVEKKLGELIELKGRIGYRGYTLEDIVGKGEGAISMSPSNINEFGTLSFTKSTYITWAKYEESPEIVLQNGFTVLVKTGSTFGKVAYIKNLNDKTTINPQLVVLKPKKVDSYFLYLLVSNTAIQTQINETVVGGAIPTLSQESISKFEILVPKTKEQEKIADCLSSLNDLIISQTERIEQLKLHKKGLMQGLFPKIND
jgi:type I restriction enzyme S subunit